jgi:hypothetical protein
MTRRRFFRVLTLTLLLLCLGVWGWSHRYAYGIVQNKQLFRIAVIADGSFFVGETRNSYNPSGLTQFFHEHKSSMLSLELPGKAFIGFNAYSDSNGRAFTIPLWFPTLLLTALTAWAWRQRRNEGARGFAVEEAAT